MPDMSKVTGIVSSPKVEDLPDGDVINIISITSEVGKTPKNGYEIMTLETKEHGTMVTLAAGVRNKLKDVLKAVEDDDFIFSEEDPLTCSITSYTSKQGREGCKALQ